MLIETYEKKYQVLYFVKSTEEIDYFLCKEVVTQDIFMIVKLKNKLQYQEVMSFLYEQKHSETFSDFDDIFISDAYVHIVFRTFEAPSLKIMLESEANLDIKERLEIARRIQEKMVLLEMPYYFQTEVLEVDHIKISPSMAIAFDYSIDHIEKYKEYTFDDVQIALNRLLKTLFEEECRQKTYKPLIIFIKHLQKKPFKNYFELYSAYSEVLFEIGHMSEAELTHSLHWAYVLWEKMKRFFKPLRHFIAVLLWLTVFVYMIYMVRNAMQPAEELMKFKSIGTLNLY